MQTAADVASSAQPAAGATASYESAELPAAVLPQYRILRRNGAVVGSEPGKLSVAMTKAFLAVNGGPGAASARIRELVASLTDNVVAALMRRQPVRGSFMLSFEEESGGAMVSRLFRAATPGFMPDNRRCQQIGIEPLYPGAGNPFPWMSEMIDLKKERNFFETRVIEYQTGGALNWDQAFPERTAL